MTSKTPLGRTYPETVKQALAIADALEEHMHLVLPPGTERHALIVLAAAIRRGEPPIARTKGGTLQ